MARYTDTDGNEVVSLGNQDKRQSIVDGLRELADFIEANPALTPYDVRVSEYVYPENFKDIVRQFGACEKEPWNETFSVVKQFGGTNAVLYKLSTSREGVCTKKVVGTETVEVVDYSHVPKKQIQRDVVEWECDPILR